MAKFYLYHTDGCHLCEQAHDMLQQALPPELIEGREIMANEQWLAEFQVSIPVVENAQSGQRLYWPFDTQQLQQFID